MKEVGSRKFKYLTILFSSLFFIVTFTLYINFLKSRFYVKEFKESIDVDYKDEFKGSYGKVCYGNILKCNNVDASIQGNVDTSKLNSYDVTYTFKYKSKEIKLKQTINVVDSKAPTIDIKDKEINICPNGKYEKLNYHATDNYDGDLTNKVEETKDNEYIYLTVSDSSNNKAIKEIKLNKIDNEKPKIIINGASITYIKLNSTYKDYGASATDNCDDNINVKVTNNVDTTKEGKYIVKYNATDLAGNEEIKERIVYVQKEPKKSTENIKDNNKTGSKIIYLTFDDGPSQYTSSLLDILKKYNVKATFFVTGYGSDDLILREFKEGHTIGLHSYNHKYSEVYSSVDNYYNDLYKVRDRVKRITGYEPTLIRFPGGSSNTVSKNYDKGTKIMTFLAKDVQEKGFYYFDWNVSSQDAGSPISSDTVYKNVVTTLRSEYSVVLQHDTKKYSIDAVERIIKFGLENGYTFEPLTEESYGAHHRISN